MMQVYLFQYDIAWEDRPANHRLVTKMVADTRFSRDSLVILPEMFDTGFSMDTAYTAGPTAASSVTFLQNLAARYRVHILAGVVTLLPDHLPHNQAILVNPVGEILTSYSKIHTFTHAGEHLYYQRGRQIANASLGGFNICPLICYDLRFPETFRAAVTGQPPADVFVIIANFPAARHDHWKTLIQARAIENQTYVIAVNRTGSDPANTYAGGSAVIDPSGKILAMADDQPAVLEASISRQLLDDYRRNFPVLDDIQTR